MKWTPMKTTRALDDKRAPLSKKRISILELRWLALPMAYFHTTASMFPICSAFFTRLAMASSFLSVSVIATSSNGFFACERVGDTFIVFKKLGRTVCF
jgi:hypothetical protein